MWSLFAALALVQSADLVIVNARLPTVAGAEAVATSGGKITVLGTNARALAEADAHTRRIDARGRLLLPGFIDSHIHFLSGGVSERHLKLEGARSIAEIQARLASYRAAHKDADWIVGRGWSYDLLGLPGRQALDQAVADIPVFLRSYDGHTGWANSKALAFAGSKDPKDGRIVREKDGVTPQGALIEGAMELIEAHIPEATPNELHQGLLDVQPLALAYGITAINDFIGERGSAETYLDADKAGELALKVFVSPPLETPLPEVQALAARIGKDSTRVRFGTLKGFVDGVIESKTAAFLLPYAGEAKERGEPHLSEQDLDRLITPLDRAGFSVSLHCIGDRAVRMALDAYERAAKKNGTRDRRHRVEHIEVLDPADAKRFAALGVVASMQPFHAVPSDMPGKGVWETNIGAARLPHIFAWHELLLAKAPLAFGSDWTVMTMDPLAGLALAVSRRNNHGLPVDGWVAAQAIGFSDALDAYTRGAAWALHAEGNLGTLAVGRAADLALLSAKVEPLEPLSLHWGAVDLTVIDGVVRYESGR